MPFTFKQFHINDSLCGMRVSTDGVLLGAWAPLTQARTILDIGTGSGLLSLMAAQRSQAQITAVELDENAVNDCKHNFKASSWSDRLKVHHSAIQHFVANQRVFDHIICNPPYFTNGPQSQVAARSTARHTDNLSFDELLSAINQLLSSNGVASLILPSASLNSFLMRLSIFQLKLTQRVDVASIEGKTPSRHLINLQHVNVDIQSPYPVTTQLNIRTSTGQYSKEMQALTRDFYLKL
ncbi:methyltransferase [uncultured Shewanella sp.]|uniref:tRNA1(Val) (adenine(37)-N6)-methyltransferase n=1 Tax=uncultured Shewanella sp. TaxID=173975 RepID=UPI00262669CF|nr:methyltransferase [uncultured Shewanella sp.]